ILDGLASAPPGLRVLGLHHLETLTGCVFPCFGPFDGDAARRDAAARMADRFSRTGFKGLGEEIERKRKLAGTRKVLEAVAILQRQHREKHGTFAGDPASLFERPAMIKASGLSKGPDGVWSTQFEFRFEMELRGEGFEARATGRIQEGDPEVTVRLRSEIGCVEILPPSASKDGR
ncbi:MAG: hypothetical protein ACYS47_16065, partial [Planctomycetota bacterium]